MQITKLVFSAAAAILFVGQAHATTLLSDNFDAENGGATAINYTGFTNFDVTGNVDLVRNGDFALTGSGSFVDLAGSPGPGKITTKSSYSFNAGDIVTLSFLASGSQRNHDSDLYAQFIFAGQTSFSKFVEGGAFGGFVDGPIATASNSIGIGVPTAQSYLLYTYSFTAAQAGSFNAAIGTTDTGNIGPLVDDVTITRSAGTVPEPAAIALFGLGAATLGLTRRRAR